ncbi:MAG TPA: hypothetical protein VL979_01655 [Solirubrobacteraceae bacterium]|nr:hypothetical protein [Solirubrobacteraceae bacterium]
MSCDHRGALGAAAAAIRSWAQEEGYELAEARRPFEDFAGDGAPEVSVRRTGSMAEHVGAGSEQAAVESSSPSSAGSV